VPSSGWVQLKAERLPELIALKERAAISATHHLAALPGPTDGEPVFLFSKRDNPLPMRLHGRPDKLALGGLPQRLVQDGLLDEPTMADALHAARERKMHFVTWVVSQNLAAARDVAIAASQEFGVPLLDLDAVNVDLDAVRLVNDKLLAKHRVLPLVKRGKRLHVAVSDPTNLHAIDEIKFQTGMSVEAVVVEDDKLQRPCRRPSSRSTPRCPRWAATTSTSRTSRSLGDEIDGDAVTRDDVEDAPIVRFVNKIMLDAIRKGASDIHFEPYEKYYRIRVRLDGVLKEVAQPPVQLAGKLRRASR
jgi:type IV pilus assembly protein PilB